MIEQRCGVVSAAAGIINAAGPGHQRPSERSPARTDGGCRQAAADTHRETRRGTYHGESVRQLMLMTLLHSDAPEATHSSRVRQSGARLACLLVDAIVMNADWCQCVVVVDDAAAEIETKILRAAKTTARSRDWNPRRRPLLFRRRLRIDTMPATITQQFPANPIHRRVYTSRHVTQHSNTRTFRSTVPSECPIDALNPPKSIQLYRPI